MPTSIQQIKNIRTLEIWVSSKVLLFDKYSWKNPHRYVEQFEQQTSDYEIADITKINIFNINIKYKCDWWMQKALYTMGYERLRTKFLEFYWDEDTQEQVKREFLNDVIKLINNPNEIVEKLQIFSGISTVSGTMKSN